MKTGKDPNHIELEQTVTTQKNKIGELEKKISDLYNNQNYFIEMMEKMNNLSFQILEEIKELKEKNSENQISYNQNNNKNYNSSFNYNQNINNNNNQYNNPTTNNNSNYLSNNDNRLNAAKSPFSSGSHFYDASKQLNVINETKADLLYSIEKNRNSAGKYLQDPESNREFGSMAKSPFNQFNLIENNYEIKIKKNTQSEKNQNLFSNKYYIEQDNSRYKIRKQSLSRTNTQNNFYNQTDKNNNSFYTNKFSNLNNNFLNEICDDETIFSLSNDINLLGNNLNEKNEFCEAAAYAKIMEILPSFFKNEKLFSNFEIKEKTIKKIPSKYDYGYFGIRCRDPLDSAGGKYYFNVYLQNTLKSNIFIGITSDARMGIPGGYHKSHNTFMYNLSNCDAFVRTNSLIGNFVRKGKSGDIYTFYADFEFKFIKLFLNGNELNHNNITVYSNESTFYPCVDLKDADDTVTFVDRIILNFNN